MESYDASIADPNTPGGLRTHLARRLRSMRAGRQGYEPIWLEIARFCRPTVSRLLQGYVSAGANGYATNAVNISASDKLNSKLMDSRAVWASGVLANGMHSGLTSPSRPWFKITTSDPELREYQSVKVYLDEKERRIYDLMARTNFYTSAKSGYAELGTFGVEATLCEQHWQYGAVNHALKAGEYWLGLDDGLVADSLYRRCDMTVVQHYQRFAKDRIQAGRAAIDILPRRVVEAYDRGNYEALFPVYHAVEPNNLRDPARMDAKGKAYRSAYWSAICEEQEAKTPEKAMLAVEGFSSKPFWAPRWEVEGSDTYGSSSPGLETLADVRQLQLEVLRHQQAIDYGVTPALRGPATLNNLHVSLQPKRITAMAMVDKDSFGPIWQVQAGIIGEIRESKAITSQAVDRGFFADLFNAITNMPGVQPRNVEELAQRNEEKLTQLGPVVERVGQEKLKPAIMRYDEILEATGGYADLIKPPELEGHVMEIEFISVLAQAQRLIGLGSIERTFGFATSIAQTFPDALDTLDPDAAMAEYGDITGLPAKIIRGKDEIAKLRDARKQAQAQAQQAAQTAEMMKAAQPAANAAQILFDSPGVGSQPSLAQRLLGT